MLNIKKLNNFIKMLDNFCKKSDTIRTLEKTSSKDAKSIQKRKEAYYYGKNHTKKDYWSS